MGVVNYGRLFDDKIPTFEEYRYEGTRGGDAWRRKVRGYWLSKAPQLKPFLDWAERSEAPCTSLATLAQVPSSMHDFSTDHDALSLSGVCWGFLNTAIHGSAVEIMRAAR